MVHVGLPERERLSVEATLGQRERSHPVGTIQLLTTIDLDGGAVVGGIAQHPRLGAAVYTVSPVLMQWIAEAAQRTSTAPPQVLLRVAKLSGQHSAAVHLTPERLFGRHCAVLGATGGGKSWTVARLLEEMARFKPKILLIDATGEFHTLTSKVQHIHIGHDAETLESAEEVVFPYSELTEGDLFALFKPSGQTQAPKLRMAMKSLKLARIVGPPLASKNGIIIKSLRPKQIYTQSYIAHVGTIENPRADFDISKLVMQIQAECVYPSGGTASSPDPTIWGRQNDQEQAYCVSLITRIEDMLQAPELSCIFGPGVKTTLSGSVASFLESSNTAILRVSLQHLPFANNAKEIVANAIGRHLLALARAGRFKKQPLIVVLDEAHQFLNKELGDENSKYPLDAFDLIAKEGRKFSLTICIATQRPRDIPEDVLSQIGTLVVHRLINDRDREVVERASGDIDRSAAAFLPTLAPGEAVIVGVDFPIPLTIQVVEPTRRPDSRGPDYQSFWKDGPLSG
jgi:hypothetical protein